MSKSYPWFKFNPADWLTNIDLRSCSCAARGTLVDLMCLAHRHENYGTIILFDTPDERKKIAKSLSISIRTFDKHIADLLQMQRICLSNDGHMYIKRMINDHAKASKDSKNGSKGGNPAIVGVNPEAEKKESKKEKIEYPPTVPTGTGKAKSFKQWTKEDFQESIIKANHDGIINKAECINFRDYWIEPSASGRMKFSLQKTWDTRLRIHNAIKMVYSKQRIETKQAANGSDYVVQTTQEDGR